TVPKHRCCPQSSDRTDRTKQSLVGSGSRDQREEQQVGYCAPIARCPLDGSLPNRPESYVHSFWTVGQTSPILAMSAHAPDQRPVGKNSSHAAALSGA